MFRDRDATEVIHAFHSDVAHVMLQRLPKLAQPPAVAATVPDVTSAQRAFRELRAKLLAEGWFERDVKAEAAHLAAWAACVALGVWAARQTALPLLQSLAFLPLGLSFTAAGWLAHDYIHGRGRFCTAMRHFGGYAAGFGATMWSDKHNRHHALTNEVGQDEDLSGGPVLFLWAPDPSRDQTWRPKQGAYFLAAFSLLHWVWRVDSLLVSIKRKLFPELLPIMIHYAFFLSLVPLSTFVASVFLGGFVMANIVTTSHQSEELLFEPEHDWVRMQFRTTRDAEPGNAFSSWLWGGMQHQLEHHLFPTMPRYRYPALIPVIKAFAKQHDLPYKSESDWDIWWRTFRNYQRVAAAPAVPGAKGPRKGVSI
jgi:fatty acid desaturase